MANTNNKNGYILNTNSGKLHTKECGDGDTVCGAAVTAGSRKPYPKYENAIKDTTYTGDHGSDCCIGK